LTKEWEISQEQWWDFYQADPRPSVSEIKSGLRIKTAVSCQYFIKGLPGLCKYWKATPGDSSRAGYCDFFNIEKNNDLPEPSGYNFGNCDFMGRRAWCDRYKSDEPDSGFICAAMNPFLTGLTVPLDKTSTDDFRSRSVKKSEIGGYNGDINSVGLCDGLGCGRGATGLNIVNNILNKSSEQSTEEDTEEDEKSTLEKALEELLRAPVKCKYYRPWQMGFGSIDPKTNVKRLPFTFLVYNLRAKLQKCIHWNADSGTDFEIVEENGNYYIQLTGNTSYCTCSDEASEEYRTGSDSAYGSVQNILSRVWAKSGSIICNGAKPECPCYTGDWRYCVDEKMHNGMRITANQILELRFWTHTWNSKKEYDAFFAERPNWTDATSSDIFTFTKWEKMYNTEDGVEATMLGKKHSICLPLNPLYRVFDPTYVTEPFTTVVEYPITYSNPLKIVGTSREVEQTFPTLIRKLWNSRLVAPLEIVFPFYSDDYYDTMNAEANPCAEYKATFYTKSINDPSKNYIVFVGYTVRNKRVYIFNTNMTGVPPYMDEYESVLSMPESVRSKFYLEIREFIRSSSNSNYLIDCYADEEGVFISKPVPLIINDYNKLVVIVDVGDDFWVFDKRIVFIKFCGGVVVQSSFEYNPISTEDSKKMIKPAFPERFSVSPTIKGEFVPIGESLDDKFDAHAITSYSIINRYGEEKFYYSYCFKWNEEAAIKVPWAKIGQSSKIFAEIQDINLNYVLNWEIISAFLKTSVEDNESIEVEMEVIYPIDDVDIYPPDGGEYSSFEKSAVSPILSRNFISANGIVLKPKDDNIKLAFNRDEWDLEVEYKFLQLYTDENIEDSVFPGEYLDSDSMGKANIDVDLTMGESSGFTIDKFNGTFPIYILVFFYERIHSGVFKNEDRIISACVTKCYINMYMLNCRSVEIKYAYSTDATKYIYAPWQGFALYRGSAHALGPTRLSYSNPCGDHENGMFSGKGPVWYPFDDCSDIDYYQEYAAGAWCTLPFDGPLTEGTYWYVNPNKPRLQYELDWWGNITDVKDVGGDMHRHDYRYCGPPGGRATAGEGGNWASNCGIQYTYYETRPNAAGNFNFVGYANKVNSVNELWYGVNGWTMPPFGNLSRDMVERYMCTDYISYLDGEGNVHRQWAPALIDNSTLEINMNCLSKNSRTNAVDCFCFIDQMNLFTLSNIGERLEIDSGNDRGTGLKRYRWEEIFKLDFALGQYPKPVYGYGNYFKSAYYAFQDTPELGNTAWVWRENWLDIERNYFDAPNGKMIFANLVKPSYVYSFYKEEHRLICTEGIRVFKFKAPVLMQERPKIKELPAVSIDDGALRFFRFKYSEYNDELIEWVDENDGIVDGSGGSSSSNGKNIYAETSSSMWIHDPNTIFAGEASSSPIEERTVVVDNDIFNGDIKKFYNRGLICLMKRRYLVCLPMKEEKKACFIATSRSDYTDSITVTVGKTDVRNIYYSIFEDTNTLVFNFPQSKIVPTADNKKEKCFCTSNITINGYHGKADLNNTDSSFNEAFFGKGVVSSNGEVTFSIPSVLVKVNTMSQAEASETEMLEIDDIEGGGEPVSGSTLSKLKEFQLSIYIPPIPDRMIDRFTYIEVHLESFFGEGLAIKNIELTNVEYKDNSEYIYVWERKYNISTYENPGKGANLNSYNILQARDFGCPMFMPTYDSDNDFESMCKTRGVWAGKYLTPYGKEKIGVTKTNLKEVESKEQRDIYIEVFDREKEGEIQVFKGCTPPSLRETLNSAGFSAPLNGLIFESICFKTDWDGAYDTDLKQYDFWQPGGHKWEWSPEILYDRCYVVDIRREIYDMRFVHINHGPGAIETPNPYTALYACRKQYISEVLDNNNNENPTNTLDLVSGGTSFGNVDWQLGDSTPTTGLTGGGGGW